mmetsp:Transcript_22539/g.33448  ORF Transcript_22539/g.33448 Transcript_22539/m.33448 type:complete len:122 (+) Transcript_22539:322-687(+)
MTLPNIIKDASTALATIVDNVSLPILLPPPPQPPSSKEELADDDNIAATIAVAAPRNNFNPNHTPSHNFPNTIHVSPSGCTINASAVTSANNDNDGGVLFIMSGNVSNLFRVVVDGIMRDS